MKWVDAQTLRRSLALAWPISLQSILTNLLSMIDVAMVSHLGDSAVAAVGLGNRFQFMLMVILLGIAWTVGVLSAQYYGADKPEKIRATIAMAIAMSFTALLPIIGLNAFLADDIMALGSSNLAVIQHGQAYLWITVPSLLLVSIILCFENAIRAVGQVKLPLALSAIAIAINVVLNFWFINGGLGLPAMGVAGAALATFVARGIQVFLILKFLHARQHLLQLHRRDLRHILDRKELKHFLRLATPMMVSFGVWSSGTFVYQIIYGRMGTQELAVMSMLAPVEAIYLSLFFGLASACSILVGQALGANRFDQAWLYGRSFAILNPVIGLLFGFIVVMGADLVLLPFAGLPQDTLDVALKVFVLISLSTWLKIINMTLAMGVLRAGGDNRMCMVIDIIGMWIVSIPLTALAAFYWQLPLFFVVLVAYSEEICKAFLFTWRVNQKRWLRNLTH